MAAFGYNFNAQFQQTTNNVLEESNQSCTAITNIDISDNQFIITGNNIGGNINLISEGASTDASCSMVSTMETSVTNILKSTLSQKNSSSSNWFSGVNIGVNAAVGIQNIENNIYQISNQSCTANNITSNTNNYTYASGNTIGGDFNGISLQQSSTDANCAMTNYMKANLFNQEQASTNQSNTVTGVFGIIAIVVVIIIIGIICYVIYANRSKIAPAGPVTQVIVRPSGGAAVTRAPPAAAAKAQTGGIVAQALPATSSGAATATAASKIKTD